MGEYRRESAVIGSVKSCCEMAETKEKYVESNAHRFSVAPMMDWSGISQKAKCNEHLRVVAVNHVVPNEVPCEVVSSPERALSEPCVRSAAAA
jgi:hypothetical protein